MWRCSWPVAADVMERGLGCGVVETVASSQVAAGPLWERLPSRRCGLARRTLATGMEVWSDWSIECLRIFQPNFRLLCGCPGSIVEFRDARSTCLDTDSKIFRHPPR